MLNRRLISSVISAIMIFAIITIAASAAIPEPSEQFYVFDEAGVITADTESYIVERNDRLYYATGAQIVIAAVNTTGDTAIREYAGDMFTEWKIGDSAKRNGVLVLLAIDDDDYWVVQGSGIEDRLTSGDIKILLDSYLEPSFAAKNYDDGVRSLFAQLLSKVVNIYGANLDAVTLPENEPGAAQEAKSDGKLAAKLLAAFVIVIAVVIVVVVVVAVVRATSVTRHIRRPARPSVMIPPGSGRPPRRSPPPRPHSPPPPRPSSAPRPAPSSAPRPASRPGMGHMGPSPRPAPRPSSAPRPSAPRPSSRPSSAPRPMSGGSRPGGMPRSGGGGTTRGGGAGRR